MQFKPGDIVQCQDQLFVVVEHSNGCVYTTDFETHTINSIFIGTDQISLIEKPANVEWLFLKRREYNSRFIRRYRGL
jgi:hypothetical protein